MRRYGNLLIALLGLALVLSEKVATSANPPPALLRVRIERRLAHAAPSHVELSCRAGEGCLVAKSRNGRTIASAVLREQDAAALLTSFFQLKPAAERSIPEKFRGDQLLQWDVRFSDLHARGADTAHGPGDATVDAILSLEGALVSQLYR